MKILLVNPVTRKRDLPKYFPLGLGLIAALLKRRGHDVEVFDDNVERLDEEKAAARIAATYADVFGLTGLITDFSTVQRLAAVVREAHPHAPIILGGGLASSFGEYVLAHTAVDYVLPGEGDVALFPLLDALTAGRIPDGLPGVGYRREGRIVAAPPGGIVTDLDALPPTDYDAFAPDTYAENMKQAWMFSQPTRALSIITSRGCPYRCIYCDKAIFGNRFRQRSAQGTVAEIERIVTRYALQGVLFADDTFTLDRRFMSEFCRLMRERLPGVRWAGNGRIGRLDEPLIAEMAAAGCDTLGFGIESGSQLILDEMRKGVRVDQALATLRLLEKHGIRPLGYITVGSFAESEETINETIAFLDETKLKAGVNFLTPFPGSPLYDEAVRRGKLHQRPEEFLDRWGAWQQTMLVNLTEMSDEELIAHKHRVEMHTGGRGKTAAAMAFTLPAAEQRRLWANALRRIGERGYRQVILFGAGQHTERFLQWQRTQDAPPVAAVFDQNPAKAVLGAQWGVPVIDRLPDDLRDTAILLSSDSFEEEMLAQLRELLPDVDNVFRIYG
ncbi:MAG TPA: radical SAM protein [bacterium]|nr:radical SAM protein [bacterium]